MEMLETPDIWTDGLGEESPVGGFEVASAGVYLPAPEASMLGFVWGGRERGVAEEYGDARMERCRAFMPVTGPLQTVQRAEFWGAVVALQSFWLLLFGY